MNQPQQIYKDHWQSYLKLGLIPYPASRNGKNPIVPWKDDLPAPCSDDYADWEEKYPEANIWVFLGDGFAVIDPDGPGAEDFVKGLNLPECPTSISGKKSIHRWFKVSSPAKPIKVQNGADETFLEIRTGNQGMFAPPSIHPETKKPYQWMEGLSPWDIEFPELPVDAYEKIKALLPKSEPKPEPRMTSATENNSLGSLDIERYLNHYAVKYKVKQDTGRTFYLLDRCLFADQHTTKDVPGDSSIIQSVDGKLGYQCFHNHCTFKTWQDARKAISGDDQLAPFCPGYVAPSLKKERGPLLLESAIFEADRFIGLSIPVKRKILNPWLSEQSINLIAGWRGTGKTWFGLSIFDAITRGESFGPWITETPVPSLYLDGEMASYDVQERIRQLNLSTNATRKTPFYIYSDAYANSLGIPRANLVSPKWRESFKAHLIEKQIRLFAIDNISSLAAGIDENSKFEWDPINQWLLNLRFAGITTVFFHHTGKEGNQRGTSAREDNLDCSIMLQRPHDYVTEQGAKFIVKFKKARVRMSELKLMGDVECTLTEIDGRLQWTWGSVKRKNQLEILRMLDEGILQTDIAKALGIDKGYVSRVKAKAIKDGHLSKTGKLTQSGFTLVNSEDFNDEF